jgi:hypothetical protein
MSFKPVDMMTYNTKLLIFSQNLNWEYKIIGIPLNMISS